MQKTHFLFCKFILLFVLVSMGLSFAIAQEPPVKIVDSGELLPTYILKKETSELQQIRTQVSENVLQDIINHSSEEAWPEGINTLEGRNRNRSSLNEYKAYKVATFGEGARYMLLRIPASMNQFQPSNMIPKRDIYFIIGINGVKQISGNAYSANEIADIDHDDASSDESMRAVNIIDTRELYATYDLRSDAVAKKLLVESGELTEEDYSVLAEMVQEKSWPEAINSYDNREINRTKIKDYMAYMALDYEYNGKELMMVYIPANENKFMPLDMQPQNGIGFYIVFNKKGVEYVEGEQD